MRNEDIPKLIIVGDSAYDTNLFNLDNEKSYCKTNLGGSSIYASIPASSIYRVGLVSNVGEDFEIEKLSKYNIDLSGVTIVGLSNICHTFLIQLMLRYLLCYY